LFYQEATKYWVKATVGAPFYKKNGKKGSPAHGRALAFSNEARAWAACALMNSSLFYIFFVTFSDCFHLSATVASAFPIPTSFLDDVALSELGQKLQKDVLANSKRKTITTKAGDEIEYAEFFNVRSRPIIDQIDRRLGELFGIPPVETDAVLGYDASLRDNESDETADEGDDENGEA